MVWHLLSGQLRNVYVHVRTLPISADLIGDYGNDECLKPIFKVAESTLNEKDAIISVARENGASPPTKVTTMDLEFVTAWLNKRNEQGVIEHLAIAINIVLIVLASYVAYAVSRFFIDLAIHRLLNKARALVQCWSTVVSSNARKPGSGTGH